LIQYRRAGSLPIPITPELGKKLSRVLPFPGIFIALRDERWKRGASERRDRLARRAEDAAKSGIDARPRPLD
jgi:hypothetical protein